MKQGALLCLLVLALLLSGCGAEVAPTQVPSVAPSGSSLVLSSDAFAPDELIPDRYSCFGQNVSPPLSWEGVPEGAQSLALLVDDPDSRPAGFVHWVIYNVPPSAAGLPEGVPGGGRLEDGTLQGRNDFASYGSEAFPGGAEIKRVGYDGPCPPGEHRYVFRLYALDTVLDLAAEATLDQVLVAMEGHVLAQAELMGRFAPP
ncbi:MAG: YbhB/YbcL family Raf kinase inhibitor-like protein [Anaerolineae bacterium]|jgi:Raf kinase inhibitor-like YbhB/YbcL family protein